MSMSQNLSPEELEKEALLEAYYECVEKLEGLHEECPLLSYHPHDKQAAFHFSDAYVRYFKGGNRSGKSKASFNEMGANVRGYRPWLPESHPKYYTPYQHRVSVNIGSTPKNLTKNVEKYIREAFMPGEITPTRKSQQGYYNRWEHKNGSTIDVYSYDQDTQAFESDSAHIWLFDEPPPREKWIAASRALADCKGRAIFAATPLVQPWMEDAFVLKADQGNPRFFVVEVSMYDNLGFGLTKEGIEQFIEDLSEDEIQTRVFGKAMHLQGLVLKEFQSAKHVIDPSMFPPDWFPDNEWNPEWGCAHAVDIHLREKQAVLWMGIARDGTRHIFDEIWTDKATIKELAEEIHERERGLFVHTRLIDPFAYAPSSVDRSTSVANEFTKHGLYYEKGSKEKYNGVWLMKNTFKIVDDRVKIYVWNRCRRFIWEAKHWIWKDWEKDTSRQTPVDKDDHMMENGRRLLQAGFNFFPRQSWNGEYKWRRH